MARAKQLQVNDPMPNPSSEVTDALEAMCLDALKELRSVGQKAKKTNAERKEIREKLTPRLRAFRERLSRQGSRDSKVGWQEWVESHREEIGISLSTANRYCGDEREKKEKAVDLQEGMLVRWSGVVFRVEDIGSGRNDITDPRGIGALQLGVALADPKVQEQYFRDATPALAAKKKQAATREKQTKVHCAGGRTDGRLLCNRLKDASEFLIAKDASQVTCAVCLSAISLLPSRAGYRKPAEHSEETAARPGKKTAKKDAEPAKILLERASTVPEDKGNIFVKLTEPQMRLVRDKCAELGIVRFASGNKPFEKADHLWFPVSTEREEDEREKVLRLAEWLTELGAGNKVAVNVLKRLAAAIDEAPIVDEADDEDLVSEGGEGTCVSDALAVAAGSPTEEEEKA